MSGQDLFLYTAIAAFSVFGVSLFGVAAWVRMKK